MATTALKFTQEAILAEARQILPVLSHEHHKGCQGKVGVVGGCFEYTGAPYFAALTALRVGADLSHVFCERDAATAIKSYSPELIVHPELKHPSGNEHSAKRIQAWFSRLDALVIGPGLGRDPDTLDATAQVIKYARASSLPLVIDGDGLFLLSRQPELISGYEHAILTPNIMEFRRLCTARAIDPTEDDALKMLARSLDNVTILQKGHEDRISDGFVELRCTHTGSARRCGGQGDLTAGSIAVLFQWARKRTTSPPFASHACLAAWAGCWLTRECNRLAFAQFGRSMVVSDMISHLPKALACLEQLKAD